ncbi:GATOR complex protein Iml1 isoform X2 [Daktulosphaira vitifoliae]|nr:GATOR complex protein Iml1 isoform X2 [Daktulosphaira vitifoliae]
MRECLQVDYKNRFYEDFYQVVIQNERYEDWSAASLMLLRRIYYTYKSDVLNYHFKVLQESGVTADQIPEAYLSQAPQGNFLEVLNMALNVFEKHYIERSLDRTGQLAIVISPGMGEFYVDRQLTNVTKQRVMDNGVGIDLICVGQEPLYAVPLFLFQNRDESLGDDCSIPHWINLSFYGSKDMPPKSTFVPRIKVPSQFSNTKLNRRKKGLRVVLSTTLPASMQNGFTNCADDYIAYDNDVFEKRKRSYFPRFRSINNIIPFSYKQSNTSTIVRKKKFSTCSFEVSSDRSVISSRSLSPLKQRSITPPPKNQCDSCISPLNRNKSLSIDDGLKKLEKYDVLEDEQPPKTSFKPNRVRGLINPFDKSQALFKLTSNRRRWSHTFSEKYPKIQKVQDDIELVGNAEMDIDETVHQLNNLKKNLDVNINIEKFLKNRIEEKQNIKNAGQKSLGEFDWLSQFSSGVDWKSLVFPACLPITTDYFPDDVTLQSYYVFSNYNLLPEDVNADFAQQRAVYRQPLSTLEVFYQMVSQRLAQGFQLVVNKSENSTTDQSKKRINSIVMRSTLPMAEPFIEMRLSIGRIVHILTLCGSEIRVTRYRPRFPYASFEIQYRYRFQAPDHSTYGISWISFVTEKLENYNWNYMDHYLCTRGDTDYALHDKLKYWRFRMYLLPWRLEATSTIMDHLNENVYCDIYKTPTMEEQHDFTNKFIKFIETWVNRLKRSAAPSIKSSNEAAMSPFRDRTVSSVRNTEKLRPRSGSKVFDRGGTVTPDTNPNSADDLTEEVESKFINSYNSGLLISKESISNTELIEWMQVGIGLFVNKQTAGLPRHTFISYDAVTWLMSNVSNFVNRQEAVDRFQEILNEQLICHASGNYEHPFIDGFYMYYIPLSESPTEKSPFPQHEFQAFENEWVEVEVKPPILYPENTAFLVDNLMPIEENNINHDSRWKVPWYKEAHLEMDVNSKSDRVEWGHARYQTIYRCDRAYEIIAQWVAASGSIVADLIYNWARKAQSGGFQLIPLPADPFALPYTLKSDPLRGPVFVPLNLECLMTTDGKNYLFYEYPEDTWLRRLLLFQEVILYRFGFIICNSPPNTESYHNQYIHTTGNMFVLILSDLVNDEEIIGTNTVNVGGSVDKDDNDVYTCSSDRVGNSNEDLLEIGSNGDQQLLNQQQLEQHYLQQQQFSPHMEYVVTRHLYHRSGTNNDTKKNNQKRENRVGFLWAWNHMVSRRWKWSNPATGDEQFQNRLLEDFRNFCGNADGRLQQFWRQCKNQHNRSK